MLSRAGADSVVLIRHARPDLRRDEPPPAWRLGADGRAAARALRSVLPSRSYLVASDEPKASETLAGASNGAAIAIDPDFGEVRRPPDWTDAHRALAAAYVGGATHAGWEPHDAVVRRFDAAVRRHQAAAAADRHLLVIGTHGMAMTLWLASRVQLDRDPVAFWAGLEFPDVVVVESGRALTRRG